VIRRTFLRGGERVDVTVRFTGSRATVTVGDKVYEFDTLALPDGGVRLVDEGGAHTAYAVPRGRGVQVRVDGATWDLEPARGKGAAATAGNGKVEAPMTGTVLDVLVAAGDAVTAEQTVAVLQAMKMEHKLAAGVAGRVVEVACRPGDIVDAGRLLVRVEPEA